MSANDWASRIHPHDQQVTVSIGMGTTTPGPGAELQDALRAVDQQLYRAKQEGRNRIAALA